MPKSDMGIKNSLKIYQAFIIAAFVVFCILSIIFWALVRGGLYYNNLLNNGIEVEAEVVDWYCIDATPDETYATYVYRGVYLYVSPEGKRYSGSCGLGASTEKDAKLNIGKKITIVIDPNGSDSTASTLANLASYKNNINFNFSFAWIFTGLFCVSAYLLFYRVVYRNRLDKKINNTLKSRFVESSATQGQVIKIFGLLWFYVKVQYNDDKGLPHKKWARSWFTRKEAKYLKQKKFINIIPYKNTYGILEEMP